MSLKKQLMPTFDAALSSDGLRDLGRRWRRTCRGSRRRFDYDHRVDDPCSALTVQALARLIAAVDVDLRILIVSAPAQDVAPERERPRGWGLLHASLAAR